MEENQKKHDVLSWSLFIGCMFIGMAVGEIYDHGGAGTMAGLGVGFIASAVAERVKRK